MPEVVETFKKFHTSISGLDKLSWTEFLPWLKIALVALGIFMVFFLCRRILTRKIGHLFFRLMGKSKKEWEHFFQASFAKPLQLFFVFLGLYLALLSLPFGGKIDLLISRAFRTALVILAAWSLYHFTINWSIIAKEGEEKKELWGMKIDKILMPFFSKMARFIIVVLAISVILQEWNYDINGFIAGLGLGGLAFALAAQQTLANFFGGIVIITDKPFSMGDWILTPSVEGLVEDINFRSTKIRTFAQALVTMPNSTLANEPITNWSRMGKRRVSFNLGINYATPPVKIEKCLTQIKDMLKAHSGVHQETIFVNFDSFGESSLLLSLYYFTNATKGTEYMAVKEDVNLKVMAILEETGVSLALPGREVYFRNGHQTSNHDHK